MEGSHVSVNLTLQELLQLSHDRTALEALMGNLNVEEPQRQEQKLSFPCAKCGTINHISSEVILKSSPAPHPTVPSTPVCTPTRTPRVPSHRAGYVHSVPSPPSAAGYSLAPAPSGHRVPPLRLSPLPPSARREESIETGTSSTPTTPHKHNGKPYYVIVTGVKVGVFNDWFEVVAVINNKTQGKSYYKGQFWTHQDAQDAFLKAWRAGAVLPGVPIVGLDRAGWLALGLESIENNGENDG
ncbi:hypothetical protein D9611_000327 [Ephemerocybe angulata]|uniref:Uncharacterized protein n=1 Tax=Ephemerocybe angulata TaxID=980116 RepID=A0A8H5BNG6_9AGAR|nr:hypothetical protein D9611_000327 [Tulosesus angulatus]